MLIQKQTTGEVRFYESGDLIKTLTEDVTINLNPRLSGVEIVDKSGRAYQVPTAKVGFLQVLPNAPTVFIGDAVTLFNILQSQFFNELHSGGASPFFGSGNLIVREEAETQTNQTAFQTKAKLTVPPDFVSGIYEVKAFAEFQVSRTNRSGFVQLIKNLTDVIAQTDQEPKDTTNWLQFDGFDQLQLNPSDFLDIRFRSEQANTTTSIRRARIRIFRVS